MVLAVELKIVDRNNNILFNIFNIYLFNNYLSRQLFQPYQGHPKTQEIDDILYQQILSQEPV